MKILGVNYFYCKNVLMKLTATQKLVIEILLIAFLVFFPHYVPLPFYSYAIVCFAAIFFYLKKKHQTLADIGLKRNGLTVNTIAIGLLSAIIWMAFNRFVYFPFIKHFFDVPEYKEYYFIKNHLFNFMLVLFAAWIVGGFYEEIVFRGFIQTTIQKWFKRKQFSFWIAAILTSVLFGLYHWQQGIFGVIPAALGGFYWSILLKRFNGNLWYPILSHAFYDTIALTMIYFGVLSPQ